VDQISNIEALRNAPDPLQAQSAIERRRRIEDFVAHCIALILTAGFLTLALISMLGFVDLNQPVVAALVGSILGYAVARLDPVLMRYFHSTPASLASAQPSQEAATTPTTKP